jgi:hypothetical protein
VLWQSRTCYGKDVEWQLKTCYGNLGCDLEVWLVLYIIELFNILIILKIDKTCQINQGIQGTMIIRSTSTKVLVKKSRVTRGFKKNSQFAICAMVWRACWAKIGQDILQMFTIVIKASTMSIGVTKAKRKWWTTYRWWTSRWWAIKFNQIGIINHRKLVLSY